VYFFGRKGNLESETMWVLSTGNRLLHFVVGCVKKRKNLVRIESGASALQLHCWVLEQNRVAFCSILWFQDCAQMLRSSGGSKTVQGGKGKENSIRKSLCIRAPMVSLWIPPFPPSFSSVVKIEVQAERRKKMGPSINYTACLLYQFANLKKTQQPW
jgi:hypothetical protein